VRALVFTSYDGPDRLHVTDVPEPESSGKVLIEVAAAGLGFADLLVSRGGYQVRPAVPFVPGMEVVGTVLAAPQPDWVGRRVLAVTGVTGGCAERVAVAPELVYRAPESLSTEVAGGFVVNFHTAWFSLVTRAALRPGETVLVHGAGGGLGQAVCSVAAALGARVAAVVSTDAKARAARSAGADVVVLTHDPGGSGDVGSATWPAQVRAEVGDVDVVVDPVGGRRVEDSIRLLAPLGRLVIVGFTSGDVASVRIHRLQLGNVDVIGAAWREYVEGHPAHGAQIARQLDALLDTGRLRPSIGRAYDWEDAVSAVDDLDAGRVLGRVVISRPGFRG
jgi:NADPH2:quinone reductase